MAARPLDLSRELDELRRARDPTLLILPDVAPAPPRIALLSGSFDPMTVAHAALAEATLREHAGVVLLTYSVRTILKEGPAPPALLPERDRLAALTTFCRRRAEAGWALAVGLCSHGLLVDQIRAARARFPVAQLALAMGSDKLLQVLDPKWYADREASLEALFANASILYAVRTGEERLLTNTLRRPENAGWLGRLHRVAVPGSVAGISSRDVRDLVRLGEDATPLVPREFSELLARPGTGDRTYNC